MSKTNYCIRRETPADYRAVENLTREAFWNVYRPACLEHYVLHTYRDRADFVPELSYVLEVDGELVGHVMYARAELTTKDGQVLPIMTFGPISIAPAHQRKGYGALLLSYTMEKAAALGAGCLCIEGNIDFYGTLGFVVASTRGVHYYAEPETEVVPYFLLKELTPHFLDGITATYHTPQGYFVDPAEADAFDRTFPAKEKLRLPTQLA